MQKNVKSSENKVTEFKDLSIEQFMSAYGRERKASAMLIDVRTPPECNDGYINGAVMINFLDDDLDKQLGMLDKNMLIISIVNKVASKRSAWTK
ncbi:MAG: rhodanese-like domain-containing protein [Saprospiraceae bacterium]|nr:rhodanese-like domain-containing protein [Saprospiraceae bacterium]